MFELLGVGPFAVNGKKQMLLGHDSSDLFWMPALGGNESCPGTASFSTLTVKRAEGK